MKPKWEDSSSWSQSNTAEDRKTPKSWSVEHGSIHITIHHHVGLGHAWFLTCHELHISRHDLQTEDVTKAKTKALDYVLEAVNELHADILDIHEALG